MRKMKQITAVLGAICLGLSLTACQRALPPAVTTAKSDPSQTTGVSSSTSSSLETSHLSSVKETQPVQTTKVTVSETTSDKKTATSIRESSTGHTTGLTTAPTDGKLTTQLTTSSSGKSTNPSGFFPTIIDVINGTSTAKLGHPSRPVPIGETAHFDGYDTLFDPFKADVSLQKVYRGGPALQMVKDASVLNPLPSSDQEYLVAQVLVKVTASKNGEDVGVSPYYFSLAREDGRMYGDFTLFRAVTPVLSSVQIGETSIGYICFMVDKADQNPSIVFLSRAHGGLWFETKEQAKETSPSSVQYQRDK